MEQTKESDLVIALLIYAMRCFVEGDHSALRCMAFGPREIDALRDMNVTDLHRIGRLRSHCLNIELNRAVYWSMIEHLRAQRQSETTLHDLIVADAPHAMLQDLFGLGSRDYSRLRRTLLVKPTVGRPPEVDEATSHRLWHAWKAMGMDQPDPGCSPDDYLTLHRETGIPMRAIWNLTRRWSQYGHLNGRTRPATGKAR